MANILAIVGRDMKVLHLDKRGICESLLRDFSKPYQKVANAKYGIVWLCSRLLSVAELRYGEFIVVLH